MNLTLIPAAESHVKKLVLIGKNQWPGENWITERFLKITLAKNGLHYTAVSDRTIVGSIMVLETDFPKFWIHFLIVDKRQRRKGIGTALLEKVEAKLPQNSFLFVDLEKSDRSALWFYKKNKFALQGKVRNWFEGGTALILAKKIK